MGISPQPRSVFSPSVASLVSPLVRSKPQAGTLCLCNTDGTSRVLAVPVSRDSIDVASALGAFRHRATFGAHLRMTRSPNWAGPRAGQRLLVGE
jgi:hypothetical protein